MTQPGYDDDPVTQILIPCVFFAEPRVYSRAPGLEDAGAAAQRAGLGHGAAGVVARGAGKNNNT